MALRAERRPDAPPFGAQARKSRKGELWRRKAGGGDVFEMREFFGPGWRMYYTLRKDVLVVMLGGGDKSTQSADIAEAIALSARLEEDNDEQ